MESILEKKMYWFNLAWQPKSCFQKKQNFKNKNHSINIKIIWSDMEKKKKTTIENDNL